LLFRLFADKCNACMVSGHSRPSRSSTRHGKWYTLKRYA